MRNLFIQSANHQDDSGKALKGSTRADSKYISSRDNLATLAAATKADNILTRVSTYRYSSDCQGCDLKAPHCLCRAHWDRFLSVLSLRATSGGEREWNEIYLYRLCVRIREAYAWSLRKLLIYL